MLLRKYIIFNTQTVKFNNVNKIFKNKLVSFNVNKKLN